MFAGRVWAGRLLQSAGRGAVPRSRALSSFRAKAGSRAGSRRFASAWAPASAAGAACLGAGVWYSLAQGGVAHSQGVFDDAQRAFDESFFHEPKVVKRGPETEAKPRSSGVLRDVFGPEFIADAAEFAIPALVNIASMHHGPWGRVVQSAGSGFVIRSDGLIATNAHVVRNAKKLTVTLHDGRQFEGRVYASDEMSDLALVQIADPALDSPLPVMTLGDSAVMRPGQFVIALGSPLNMYNSVTAGIVSSTARGASELGIPQGRTDYIQCDAAINQGNSGGPLINLHGEVVGINTMKVAGGDGIGFAIPINTAWLVLSQLMDKKKVVRPFLGLRMAALNERLVKYEKRMNSKFPDVVSGLLVVNVAKDSPASKAGIRPGDIIVSFDGKPVKGVADLTSIIGYNVGVEYQFEVVRPGESSRRQLSITSEGLQF